MKLKTAFVSLATIALLVGTAGCGSSTQDSGSASPKSSSSAPSADQPSADGSDASTSTTIVIKDFKYKVPKSVAPGAKITVKNEDTAAHTATADGKGDFDVKLDAGGTGTFTAPTKPGTYKIKCSYHPNMSGTLVVK